MDKEETGRGENNSELWKSMYFFIRFFSSELL